MIRFVDVTKRYNNGYIALERINFHLRAGEFAFLTGHSGAGKSTLLKLIACMERPSEGKIFVARQNLADVPNRKIPYLRRNIGIITQTPYLLMEKDILTNVALPLVIAGYTYRDLMNPVQNALQKVGLEHKAHRFPYELSSGEQQRVGIARAVVNEPDLLLADEPTGNLDPQLAAEIMHLFQQFNRTGKTVLIASHDLSLIGTLHHRVLTLREGHLL